MGLFGKKGRGIITNKKFVRSNRNFSDEEIGSLQFKSNLLIRVSKIVTIIVMVAMLVYIIVWEKDALLRGNILEQLLLIAVSVILVGIGANALTYYLIAKPVEGSFWTAYRQQYLINMVKDMKGIGRVTYKEQPGLSYEELKGSVLVLCDYDRLCRTQDCLYGDINGDDFRLTNFKAGKPKRKENGRMGEVRLFDGIIGLLNAEEKAALSKVGFVQVFSEGYSPGVAGYVGEHLFKTGNEEFDARFKIYVEKPGALEGFFNSDFMEAAENFAGSVKTPVAFSFNRGTMFFAFNDYPDIFEARLDQEVTKQQTAVKALIQGVQAAQSVYDAALDFCNFGAAAIEKQ